MDLTLDYVAGFFDGEGCISISPTKGVRVILTNTDLPVLVAVHEMFGCTGTISEKLRRPTDRGSKPCYSLTWWSRRAEAVLLELGPHLRLKRREADLALEFLSLTQHRVNNVGGRQRLPQGVRDRRLAIVAECASAKRAA